MLNITDLMKKVKSKDEVNSDYSDKLRKDHCEAQNACQETNIKGLFCSLRAFGPKNYS